MTITADQCYAAGNAAATNRDRIVQNIARSASSGMISPLSLLLEAHSADTHVELWNIAGDAGFDVAARDAGRTIFRLSDAQDPSPTLVTRARAARTWLHDAGSEITDHASVTRSIATGS